VERVKGIGPSAPLKSNWRSCETLQIPLLSLPYSQWISHCFSVLVCYLNLTEKKLIRLVTLPNPDQGICKSLLINPPVAMAGRTAKYKTIIIPFCFKRCCRALVGHHPIMMGQFRTFCAIVVFRYMSKNAQWFSSTVFNQLFSRVVLPCPEWIF